MDLKLYKNAWRIYLNNFGKLFNFSLAIMVMFIGCVTTFTFLFDYDFGILSILILMFLCVPFLFSYQIVIGKVSSGRKIEYNELYLTYKAYYAQQNKGTYRIFKSILWTLLFSFASLSFMFLLHDIIFPDVIDNIIASYDFSETFDVYLAYDMVNEVLNANGFAYFYLVGVSFTFIFFFSKLKKNFMVPYFSMMNQLPIQLTHSINDKLIKDNKKDIRKLTSCGDLLFVIAFLIGFNASSILSFTFINDINLSLVILIGLIGGLLLSFFLLPPIMITYCFIADALHPMFGVQLQAEIIKMHKEIHNNKALSGEQKEQLDKYFTEIEKQFPSKDKEETVDEDNIENND